MATANEGVLVKRYAGRRLYDPDNRRYVSADPLCEWATRRVAFCVVDALTGEDVTRLYAAP